MEEFSFVIGKQRHVFRFGVHFAQGNERMVWTPDGITKLINCGLWRREFDKRGNLLSRPISVADAIRLAKKQTAALTSATSRDQADHAMRL